VKAIPAKSFLFLIFLLYFLSGVAFLPFYQYQINDDGVAYISVANKYLHGNFEEAVNGYWAPLLSWLLVPFLWLGVSSLLAVKILAFIVGGLILAGVVRLCRCFEMTEGIRNAIVLSLIFPILWWAYSIITPDILLTCILIFYFSKIFDPHYPDSAWNGILCGILGTVGYLAKTYAFYFFALHFCIFNAIWFWQAADWVMKRRIVRNWFLGILVFFALSAAWVMVLNGKYHQIAFGTGGKFNHALFGPEMKGVFPMLSEGFLEPPDPLAVSAWDDPSFMEVRDWSLFQSPEFFLFQVLRISDNVREVIRIYFGGSVFSAVVLLAYLYLSLSRKRFKLAPNFFYPLLTIALYPAGYLMICVAERFLWPCFVLIVVMGGCFLSLFFRRALAGSVWRGIILAAVVFSFLFPPLLSLKNNLYAGKNLYELAQKLKKYKIEGNLAVNRSNWYEGLYLSHYLGTRYYGQPKAGEDEAELMSEMSKHRIGWYLNFKSNETALHFRGDDALKDLGGCELEVFHRPD